MSFDQQYTFSFPTLIRFGKGVVKELGIHLKEKGLQNLLLVTDPQCRELPFFKQIVKDLEGQGLSVEVFSGISKNPVKSNVEEGGSFYHGTKRNAIVGLGGGASLDVARALALRVHHPGDLFDYEDPKGGDQFITREIPYFVTVPTTSGTGSEVGRSAIISDDKTHEKKILFSPRLLAKIVFADPELTLGLPPFVTAATGMDALTHNVEAFVAKGFHPLCDGIALEGIKLVAQSLERAVLRPDLESRSQMMMAALMGAVAFQKGLGVVHSLAHPMSTLFDTHHGLANAIFLPYGVKFNQEVVKEKLREIGRVFGTDDLSSHLQKMNELMGLPNKIAGLGVKEKDLKALANLAFKDFCHPNNPRPVSEKDFLTLYQEAL